MSKLSKRVVILCQVVIFVNFLVICYGNNNNSSNKEDLDEVDESNSLLSHAKRLHDNLFWQDKENKKFDRIIRPRGVLKAFNNESTTPLIVEIHLLLVELAQLDIRDQVLVANFFLALKWVDERYTWDPQQYGGITEIKFDAEALWLPDIVLYNTANGEYSPERTTMGEQTKAVLYSNGTVIWKPPAVLNSFCDIDMSYFPYDQQCCYLKMGSWTYSAQELKLVLIDDDDYDNDVGHIDLSFFEDTNAEWELKGSLAKRYNRTYVYANGVKQTYTNVKFTLCFKRRSFFYTIILILPSTALMLLAICSHYLPGDCGEQVGLSMSILLSVLFFLNYYLDIAPASSLVVPLVGKHILLTTLSTCISITAAVFTLHYIYIANTKVSVEKEAVIQVLAEKQRRKQQFYRQIKRQLDNNLAIALSANRDLCRRARSVTACCCCKVVDNDDEKPKQAGNTETISMASIRRKIRCAVLNDPDIFSDKLCELLLWSRQYRVLIGSSLFHDAIVDIGTIAEAYHERELEQDVAAHFNDRARKIRLVFLFVFLFLCITASLEIFQYCCMGYEQDDGALEHLHRMRTLNGTQNRTDEH